MTLNKKGITLYELMATIIILCIILTISFPVYTSIISSAKQDATIANAHIFVNKITTHVLIENLETEHDLTDNFYNKIESDFGEDNIPFFKTISQLKNSHVIKINGSEITIDLTSVAEFNFANPDCNSSGELTRTNLHLLTKDCVA